MQFRVLKIQDQQCYLFTFKYSSGRKFLVPILPTSTFVSPDGPVTSTIDLPLSTEEESFTTYDVDVLELDQIKCTLTIDVVTNRLLYLSSTGITLGSKPIHYLLYFYDIYLLANAQYEDDDIHHVTYTLLPNDFVLLSLRQVCNVTSPTTLYIIYLEYFKAFCKTYPYGGSTLYDTVTSQLSSSPLIELWNSGKVVRTDNPLVLGLKTQLGLTDTEFYGLFHQSLLYQLDNYL